MNTRVSIVTICYNAAKDLPITMESVLAQDYSNYEYIIQDGASTDNSPEIINSYKTRFEAKGIHFVYNCGKDGGIYDAMNKAVKSCSGKWVNFMNAGDCFYSSNVLSGIFSTDNEYLKTDSQDTDKYIDTTIIYGDCVEYEYGRFNLFQKNIKGIEEVMPFSHQSVFAKRDFLIEHPFKLEFRYSADYDFLLTAHKLNKVFTDSGLVVCITNKNGVSSVNYHDMLIESANILKSHGLYHHSEDELVKIERILKLKQFVLDHFPDFIIKAIRSYQIKQRGQSFDAIVPPWYNQI